MALAGTIWGAILSSVRGDDKAKDLEEEEEEEELERQQQMKVVIVEDE